MSFPLIALLVLSQAPADRAPSFDTALVAQLDEGVPAWLEQYGEPGLALVLVEDGHVTHHRAYGLADRASGRQVTPDTVFQVGSISKTFTAWAVMELVEQGRVELDAPVDRYLKRWHLPESEYDAAGVTVRRLLEHTAGISLPSVSGHDLGEPLPTLVEELDRYVRIEHEPGAGHVYSGGGYALLQLLIEDVTGEDFAEHLQAKVFAPLGMSSTHFGWSAALAERVATPYGEGEEEPYPHRCFPALAAAGAYTTVRDLGAFLEAHFLGPEGAKPGRVVLAEDVLESMWATSPASPRYGLGYEVPPPAPTSRVVMHSGSNRGWKADFFALPDDGLGIAVVTNVDGGRTRLEVVKAWRDAVVQRGGH